MNTAANKPLSLSTEGDTHIVITRRFSASPAAVYRAHTDPAIVQRWMLGPEGWTMPVCISELRTGGHFRYEWAHSSKPGFHITGEFLELEPNRRIVHVERMFLPFQTPDNHVETTFEPDGDGTLMTMRMTLPDAETRKQMLATGMAKGMEDSYARLDSELA